MNVTVVDVVGAVGTVLLVLGYVPQTVRTIRTRSTDDIATTSFVLLALGSVFFMIQGFLTHNYYLAVANLLTAAMSVVIFSIKVTNDIKKRRRKSKSAGSNQINEIMG